MCLAVPGRVISIANDATRTSKVAFGSVVKEASLALVPEALVGDWVIVHAGVALQVLDEAAAQDVFAALSALEEALESEGVAP